MKSRSGRRGLLRSETDTAGIFLVLWVIETLLHGQGSSPGLVLRNILVWVKVHRLFILNDVDLLDLFCERDSTHSSGSQPRRIQGLKVMMWRGVGVVVKGVRVRRVRLRAKNVS